MDMKTVMKFQEHSGLLAMNEPYYQIPCRFRVSFQFGA